MNTTVRSSLLGLAILSLSALPSTLFAAEKAVMAGRAAATQEVGFDVYIPIQKRDQMEADLRAMHDPASSTYQKWLTPAQFNARYGASPNQIKAIQNQLAGYGLSATLVSGHHVHVTGAASSVERALGTSLATGTFKSGRTALAATGSLTPPDALVQVNAAVVGLSSMIRMRTQSHISAKVTPSVELPANRYSTAGGYWFDDLKQAYSFPSYQTYTGKGITIATLIDGAYIPADMTKYFTHELLATPNFSEINVDGGSPVNDDSFETNLDFQQVGGMAPDATIIHYNIPDLSDQSIIDGLSKIVSDNKADIVSMSFGGAEIFYTAGDNEGTDFTYLLKEEDDLMAQGNAQGITFVASSGDSGGLSAIPVNCFNFQPNCGMALASANFPASSPHVTGVGGTNLATTFDGATRNSAYVSEEAYADPLTEDIFFGTSATGSVWGSGGGDSVIFTKPIYQFLVSTGNKSFRTVPDIALHMGGCPGGSVSPCNPADSFDYEVYQNLYYGVIGTSASAPDFAGLMALNNQRTGGRAGNANYYVYTLALLQNVGIPLGVFRTGIPGNNGVFSTTPKGYNRVLGNGTLNGVKFLLAPIPAAGVPQTPTNP
ncbi:S53 family peptidase [Granulicella arctica]|uniref:S53 family peptidase n=1 Tax=Granulicella arctica TaxID=940613 RepID=UPI0021E08469|nr:S53 family peptidase [Granulicella arctica]